MLHEKQCRGDTNAQFEKLLAKHHSSLLKWRFVFFIGNLVIQIGFLIAFMQLVKP